MTKATYLVEWTEGGDLDIGLVSEATGNTDLVFSIVFYEFPHTARLDKLTFIHEAIVNALNNPELTEEPK